MRFFVAFVHLFYSYVMVVGVVATTIEGKKSATATPKPRKVDKKISKQVTAAKKPKVTKVDKFINNVSVEEAVCSYEHFIDRAGPTFLLSVNGKIPPQMQRKTNVVKGRVHFFDPSKFDKECFRREVRQQFVEIEKFTGPVFVLVRYYFSIPLHNPTSIKKGDYYDKTPDIDNLQKFLLDALKGLCYDDDRQVVSMNALKLYDDHDHVKIYVAEKQKYKPLVIDLIDSDPESDGSG